MKNIVTTLPTDLHALKNRLNQWRQQRASRRTPIPNEFLTVPYQLTQRYSAALVLIIMLPNIVPLVISLGIMYLMDIPLNLFTVMIGSIALGIAVDDTIHFTHSYRAYRQANMTNLDAIKSTMLTSGSAMLVTAVVLSLGFLIYCLATMEAVCQFGLVASMCIFLAFIADVTLTPALVTLYHKFVENEVEKSAFFPDKVELQEQHA